jgi:hypothetical protein
MWILVLLAISITNPENTPGFVTLEFPTQKQCESALASMHYELRYKSFKVIGECAKKQF